MTRITLHSVGEVAALTHVSVRTLHHYDEIGLLRPATRATGGRRLYDRDNVMRLQQILTWRTLGLSLTDIGQILDDPDFDRRGALLRQREEVRAMLAQNEALLRGIDAAIAAETHKDGDCDMSTLFDGFDPKQFEDEARATWGETAANGMYRLLHPAG